MEPRGIRSLGVRPRAERGMEQRSRRSARVPFATHRFCCRHGPAPRSTRHRRIRCAPPPAMGHVRGTGPQQSWLARAQGRNRRRPAHRPARMARSAASCRGKRSVDWPSTRWRALVTAMRPPGRQPLRCRLALTRARQWNLENPENPLISVSFAFVGPDTRQPGRLRTRKWITLDASRLAPGSDACSLP